MKGLMISFLCLFFYAACFCQTDTMNFGFEKTFKGSLLPDDWFQWGSGYVLKIDTVTKTTGKNSVVLQPLGEKLPNTFGCVAYAIPARYEAKEIELRARMKFSDVSLGNVGLLLRIDGGSGILGFQNMQNKNIHGSSDWSTYSVKLPYPAEAKTIYIGALLSGTGKLWADDFEVLLDGIDIRESEILPEKKYKALDDTEFDKGSGLAISTLTEANIRDLEILCKVWGFLKYYHPAIALGNYNWDYELFRITPKIINSKSETERNAILNEWCLKLGEFEEGKIEGVQEEIKIQPDLSWINEKILGRNLAVTLNNVNVAKRSHEHFYIALTEGVGNPIFKNEKPYSSMAYSDVGIRLLALFRYWNMINYYFPYKNLIRKSWDKVLAQSLPKFFQANNELSYKLAVLSLIAEIHDTHANISEMDQALNGFRGRNYPPVEVSFIEGKAIVTGYFDKVLGEKSGLTVGDEIKTIENKPVDEIVKNWLPLAPASNYPTQLRNIAALLLRSNKSSLEIRYSNGRESLIKHLDLYNTNEINVYSRFQKRDSSFRMINTDIAYIYPGTLTNQALPEIMQYVSKTKGLIIDFRSYPKDFTVFTLSAYLLPEEKSFVKFSGGSLNSPGQFSFINGPKIGGANSDYYKGRVVILINETTQSSAEYHTMALRTAPRATVIGSTTAGADGNVSRIQLPGNIITSISGIGIYYPDGTETQRVGIVPDIEVKPTIKGIRAGKDELMEKALEIINSDE